MAGGVASDMIGNGKTKGRMDMKKILIISLSIAVLAVSARASVIIGSVTGRSWNVTGSTTGAVSLVVNAQADDVVVMGYAGNKTGTIITPTLTVTAGGANLLSPVTTSVSNNVYPLAFARYYKVTAPGSFTFEFSTGVSTAGLTSAVGGYGLRAGTSGYVLTNVASAVFQDTLTTFDNGGNNSLSYSWANNISGGVVVEYIASRLATNTAPTGYSVNYSSTATNRMMVSYANVTGTSLTSTYTHLAPGANDTAGYVGLVFTEVVPEPATIGMLGLGGLIVIFVRRFINRT